MYTADRNPSGEGRSGTISVGDRTFTANQLGALVTLSAHGVMNAASYQTGTVAPGEVVALFGSGMGPDTGRSASLVADGTELPAEVAGTRVWFDDLASPLLYASDGQVSAIVPYDVAGRPSVDVRVEYSGVRSNAVNIKVAPTAPGIFTATGTGTGQGSILNQDYRANSASNPAGRNQLVLIYLTGAGVMDPASGNGVITGATLQKPVAAVTVQIGGVDAPVLYAGSAPGLVSGLVQVNVRIPQTVPVSNAAPVVVAHRWSGQPSRRHSGGPVVQIH